MKTGLLSLLFFLLGCIPSLMAESISTLELDSAFLLTVDELAQLPSDYSQPNALAKDQVANFSHSGLAQKYHKAFQENRRLTAAMLTFALGMLGVHRLYLGTKPWIPAVYLFTFGGGFLILPLIDLGVILFCKDLSKYENNDKVLMWVK